MPAETCEFQAQLVDWKEIHELPGGWPIRRLQSLLNRLEVEDVSEADTLEMTLLALQDFEPDEAADRVLETVFGDTMRPGIMQNLAHELTEERPWEEFADISHQAGIFNTVVLLQQAFPREFDKPDAVSVIVRLDTASEKGMRWLNAPTPDAALLLRILADSMNDRSVLRRVFGEALKGRSFPDATSILWHVCRPADATVMGQFAITSSHQWFDPLKDLENWTATAWCG